MAKPAQLADKLPRTGQPRSSAFVRRSIGHGLGRYLRLVAETTRFRVDLERYHQIVEENAPAILTAWHGMHLLPPALIGSRHPVAALVSRSRDGEINAAAIEAMKLHVIRGSGGRSPKNTLRKGGVRGLLEMLSVLDEGMSVALTASVPRGPRRRCSRGIIALARHSGRPILPVAVVTRPDIPLRTWDRMRIPLPFGRGVCVIGAPISVASDADAILSERARQAVEAELVRIGREADAAIRR